MTRTAAGAESHIAEPWRRLPPGVAEVIEPELEPATEEILVTIAREVPEYARPLEGSFGRGIRTGVSEALRQFVALVRDPDSGRGTGRDVYVALGRGELRQGRTLDSLQSAYRVGARVAWRRVAAAATRAGLPPEVLSLLAESIFAYIDELSADSVEGYARAQSEREGERQRRQRALVASLLRDPPVADPDLRAAADRAGWRLPGSAAALACAEADLPRLSRRLPGDALAVTHEGAGCVVVPDPDGPGRRAELAGAASDFVVAMGPSGPRQGLPLSWALARSALRARTEGEIHFAGLLPVEEHLGELLLFEGRAIAELISRRRLAPLDGLTVKAQARMRETALAYVQHHGNAAAMARSLHLHPQTVRHRLGRLRELLGDQLDDPTARFELEVALRAAEAAEGGD